MYLNTNNKLFISLFSTSEFPTCISFVFDIWINISKRHLKLISISKSNRGLSWQAFFFFFFSFGGPYLMNETISVSQIHRTPLWTHPQPSWPIHYEVLLILPLKYLLNPSISNFTSTTILSYLVSITQVLLNWIYFLYYSQGASFKMKAAHITFLLYLKQCCF